jgi:hypothetical protein
LVEVGIELKIEFVAETLDLLGRSRRRPIVAQIVEEDLVTWFAQNRGALNLRS